MSARTPYGDWVPPTLSGVLLALAFPPLELLLPPFVGLVPFLAHLSGLPAGPHGRRAAVRAGLILGIVYYALLLHWMVAALSHVSRLAVPSYAATVLVLAAFPAAAGGAVHRIRERSRIPLPVTAAVVWTAMEWVQGHLGPFSFPWLGLGTALAPYPRAAGAADLVGAGGLTFWLVLINGSIASSVVAARGTRPRLAARTALAGVLALPAGYGAWRVATLEMHAVARVAIVQPNIEQHVKMDSALALDSSMTALDWLTRRIAPGSADLVVWPEVAVPAVLRPDEPDGPLDRVRELSRDARTPILAGSYGSLAADGTRRLNSALLVDPRSPALAAYHKRRLVPFFERVPLLPADHAQRGTDGTRRYGALAPGPPTPPISLDGRRFGVLICFESTFAPLARAQVNAGADFLVNITNDAWLATPRSLARTGGLWQHPAHLSMRAIELRTGIARAANTGFSMVIDPFGRVHDRSPLFEPAAYTATVYTTGARTVYARAGDWLPATCAAAALLLALAVPASRGRGSLDPMVRFR